MVRWHIYESSSMAICRFLLSTGMVIIATWTLIIGMVIGTTTIVSSLFANYFLSLVYYLREFSFSCWVISWLFHPPSIFPISINLSIMIKYFLSSNADTLLEIFISIFKVSLFLTALCIYKSFCFLSVKYARDTSPIISINIESIFAPKLYLCIFGKCIIYPCHSI